MPVKVKGILFAARLLALRGFWPAPVSPESEPAA